MPKTITPAEPAAESVDEHHHTIGVLLRFDERDLKLFDRAAKKKGMKRSEALRVAAKTWARRML